MKEWRQIAVRGWLYFGGMTVSMVFITMMAEYVLDNAVGNNSFLVKFVPLFVYIWLLVTGLVVAVKAAFWFIEPLSIIARRNLPAKWQGWRVTE